jgi:hypothetical protein
VPNIISPVAEYQHNGQGGNAIIGGYVYRGSQYPTLNGYYFYTDNGTGNMWAMRTCSWQVVQLGHMVDSPSTFGQDAAGELYIAGLDGVIHKLVGPTAPVLPFKLFLPLIFRNSACGS